MGILGSKTDRDVLLEPFVLASVELRLVSESAKLLADHLQKSFGTSASVVLRAFASHGQLSQSQLDSFTKDVFRPTYDAVLYAVKNVKRLSDEFPPTAFEKEMLDRINLWVGSNAVWNSFFGSVIVGYMGAAFDLMNQKRPRMELSGRLILEGCYSAAVAVVAVNPPKYI
jgi:hypothetical protein